jgi:hypothetical protein
MIGLGRSFVVDGKRVLMGTLGEGPGRIQRELFFAWFLWGMALLRVRVLTGLAL